ncbi:DUF5994 family protein [Mycobacterium sp. DL592]|uniref:DUF5994 family protein n=1 Tax=Mycobacterium sp. DL592 TaxID=2675524 RepID=UPI0014231E61|nr:DUF5994 family protein [Mycobacterium sp. DL592]
MTPNPNTAHSSGLAGNPTFDRSTRLQLNPSGPAEPYLDGAWWPRSTELAVELPGLLAELSAQLGPVVLIGYRRGAWTVVPDHLDLAERVVHLQGFVSSGPPTLVVVDDSGRRVTLRVVPPDTEDASAVQLMVSAATDHSDGRDNGVSAINAQAAVANSLDEVAMRLARLPGTTGRPGQAELISRWVIEAADQFRDAPIQAFVPILVEHIVRGWLYNERADRPARSAG